MIEEMLMVNVFDLGIHKIVAYVYDSKTKRKFFVIQFRSVQVKAV